MDIPAILISQYLAALEMLQQTIAACPASIWNSADDQNKFWQVAYHALFFTHEYVSDSEEFISPWRKHREGTEDFPAPPGEPYDQEAVLEFLAFCQQQVVEKVPKLNLEGPERHGDGTLKELELQIYALRHLMQHTGELMERLGARTGAEIEWVGWKHAGD